MCSDVCLALELAPLARARRRLVDWLRERYAKDLVPIEQLQDELNEALGGRTFQEFLDDARPRH